MGVKVVVSRVLRERLVRDQLDVDLFAQDFRDWKEAGASGEDDFYGFGKDGAYRMPKVDEKLNVLRHVHLVPLNDPVALRLWDRMWNYFRRRTSDRVLVYVGNSNGSYLLLTILPEPGAHEIAKMMTREHLGIMNGLAQAAEAFLWDETDIT